MGKPIYRLPIIVVIFILLAGCSSQPAPIAATQPLAQIAPTAATSTPRQPTATFTPQWTSTPDPDAIEVTEVDVNLRQRRVVFIVRVTPKKALLKSATLNYTYPTTQRTERQNVGLPGQKIGDNVRVEFSMSVDKLPVGEALIDFRWEFTDQNGNTGISEQKTFKLTEASTGEQRNSLPIIDAELSYVSEFPKRSTFTVSLTPKAPIQFARFFYTQNSGILLHDFAVTVPTKKAGEPLTLKFVLTDQLGLQIPWQQFEWWWVFTDQMGRTWRTEHAFNEYEDKRFHKWTRTQTKHTVLFTYDRTKADIAVLTRAADDGFELLEKAFGYKLLYQPHIVVYNNQQDFEDWAPPSIVDYFLGMASGEWGGAVVAFYSSIRFTGYSIVIHELAHLFQYQSIRRTAPTWWYEGSANYFEQERPIDVEDRVRRIVKRGGEAPSLTRAVPARPPDGSTTPWPYYVGSTFVTYLTERYGRDTFVKIHIALARDIDFAEAIKMATSKTLMELSQEWGDWISN